MKAHIVIGANFGDEGKGQVTQYLCHKLKNPIIVRHNGGAQAAHTVVTNNWTRYVFHHFGSGTNLGIPTFLSEYFISNPRVFAEEFYTNNVINSKIICHIDSPLTIPYDWLLNREAEALRGQEKHGSCGLGINETVTRCETKYKTTVADLQNISNLEFKLKIIAEEYLPKRAKELGVSIDNIKDLSMNKFLEDCYFMLNNITLTISSVYLLDYDNIIFEGAQGLLLDEDHYYFPHVTRSKTGSINAIKILKEIKVYEASIYYVTRTYLTRHGAGPLPYEYTNKTIEDVTNIPNAFQGKLRFAPINLDLMIEATNKDLNQFEKFTLDVNVAITWASAYFTKIDIIHNKKLIKTDLVDYLETNIRNLINSFILFDTPKSEICAKY